MRRLLAAAVVALLALGTAAGSVAADRPITGRLLITGSSTMAPLITHIVSRYRRTHPGVQITVRGISSSQGIMDTRRRLNSIGMVSRTLSEAEKDLNAYPLARDGVCFIVSRDNPVRSLTAAQLADIFSGRITSWKELGGSDAPISVVLRDEGGASSRLVAEYLSLKVSDLRGVVIPAENSVTMKVVGRNRHAISYVSFAELNRHDDARDTVRVLPAGGVLPSLATIDNGTYPLARVLNLVTRGEPSPQAKDFIGFALSGQAADIIAGDGFMPLPARKKR